MKKKGLLLGIMPIIAVWFVLALMMARAHADTNVSGYISSDTTWTAANSPYIVTGSIIVREGVTLTIEAGVTVKFDEGKALQIQGTLVARGSSSNYITFTASGTKYWAYIAFDDTSADAKYDQSDNYASGSIMEYCTVEYTTGALMLDNAHPFINYCTIRNNTVCGISALKQSGLLKITNCTITNNESSNNAGGGIYLSTNSKSAETIITSNTIKNNYSNASEKYSLSYGGGIYIYGLSEAYGNVTIKNNTISGNKTTNDPYYSGNSYPASGGGIYIDGSTVTITNNTISDNTASSTNLAMGGGIYIYSGKVTITNNTIDNNTANSSGSTGADGGGIYIGSVISPNEDCDVTIENNTISNSTVTGSYDNGRSNNANGGGIYINNGDVMIKNNTISSNSAEDGSAIYHYAPNSRNIIIQYNSITGNKTTSNKYNDCILHIFYSYPLFNYNNIYDNIATYELLYDASYSYEDLDAKDNWWGSADENIIQGKIYDGIDDSSKALVDYYPYSTSQRTDTGPNASKSPTATTSDATSVTSGSATLNGTVNANGSDATVWFEYGNTSGSYSNKSSTQTVTGSTNTNVSASITGLTANTVYYYRVVAENSGGKSEGSEKTFTTITSLTPVPTPTPTTTIISDDFNDNSIDSSLWTLSQKGSGPTITETNQRLEIYFPANSEDDPAESTFSAGYTSVCTLRGDFDIQVDYELISWPNSNGIRIGLIAEQLVERVSFGDSYADFPGYNREVYLTHFDDGVQGFISTSDTSGKLRLVRSDSTITGYYYSSDNWVAIHSSSTTTDDVDFSLSAWSHNYAFTDQEVKVVFDNFIVNQGQLICPETTPTPSPTPSATPSAGTGYILGSVVDSSTRRGISEATVTTDIGGYSATTDSIGSYQISNVAEGSYTLTATATGYESGLQSVTVTANAVTTANIELTPESTPVSTGAIAGTVLDSETGKGISGATVSTDSGGYSTTTDARGSYRIQNVNTGSYTLTAEADGYEGESESVTVTANALSTVNFSLEPSGSTGTAIVYGSVEDEYGDYFEGVEITISGNGYSDETETDEYGDYELYEVPAGSYTLTFEAKGYETQSVTITVKAGDMYEVDTVQMETEDEDLGLISGYAYDIDGEPVEDVKVTAKNISTGEKVKEYTDGDGFFEFEDMEPGTYKVSTKKKGYRNSKETVTLKSEQEKYVEFELRTSSKSRLIIMPGGEVIGQ